MERENKIYESTADIAKKAIKVSIGKGKTPRYDVFLSFNREDARNKLFTGFLYRQLRDAGVRAYFNEAEFDDSEGIRSTSIENSAIVVPVFCRNYASSKSRLMEVEKFFECMRSRGQIVLPIFYQIEPSDVQNQTGTFKQSFLTHQKDGVEPQVLRNWRTALRHIGSLNGYTISGDKDKLVDEVVSKIMELLWTCEISFIDKLFGMEQSIQAVAEMLQVSSSNVLTVGICGMPKIGKTTLAKVVYNKLHSQFEGCSFVPRIRERCGETDLRFLQILLISQLLKRKFERSGSIEENIEFIKQRFNNLRVLIVLDDVESLDHIKAFGVELGCYGPGSKIILTTQKLELLLEAKVTYTYTVQPLDGVNSLRLFNWYAFGEDPSEEVYRRLSAEISIISRGNPSNIKILGSFLSKYTRNSEQKMVEEILKETSREAERELPSLAAGSSPTGDCKALGYHNDVQIKVKDLIEAIYLRIKYFGIDVLVLDGDVMQVNGVGKIFIPIISESFVLKKASLSKLVDMVECFKNSPHNLILPIFFTVKSPDVSLETPLFQKTLFELYERFKGNLVNGWKDAIIEAPNISGWSIPETFKSEEIDNLANSVCQMVLHKLKLNELRMCKHLVRFDHHVDGILKLLDLGVNDVQVVGICGQDGVGKTTLARVVYHQLCSSFESCCFLDEIDERARHSGIQSLQAKMISDLLNGEIEVIENMTEGKNLIEARFRHMKVLIVLDGVAKNSHLEALAGHIDWFGPGSRIIITTDRKDFKEFIPSSHIYEISFDFRGALQLFSRHAFSKYDPVNKEFDALSRNIVDLLDPDHSSPLSIEIVGSLLYGKSVVEWESALERLKTERASDNYVEFGTILRMSYDTLNEKQKQIFLDLACFCDGMDSQIASSFWHEHDSLRSPISDEIEALILLSLAKIDANNSKEIWMHPIVRGFGREIVYRESCVDENFPRQEKNQQVKSGYSISCPLSSLYLSGIEEFEVSDTDAKLELTDADFKLAPNIKFLRLCHENNIHNDFNMVFARLRGLSWRRCPLLSKATGLRFESIVVLDFSWCKNLTGCRLIEAPRLRILNLTGCTNLLETPDFSFCRGLETLILEYCSRLVKIDPSICYLQHLAVLNLRNCTELSLLPKDLGYLKALKELKLDGTSIQEIPVSIGYMKNVQTLTATSCSSLGHLPNSICDILSVTVLKLDCTNIAELPRSIWKRKKLRHLSLRDCQCIKSLPSFEEEAGCSLVELDVSGTSIIELPQNIVYLRNLKVLKLDFCFISEFPPEFGNLKNLEEIHASSCKKLKELPDGIGNLVSLRVIKLRHCCITSIPKSIQQLKRLEILDCTSCNKLQRLPELPSSLTSLHVQSAELTLPDLVNLRNLRELTLGNGDSIPIRFPLKAFATFNRSSVTDHNLLYWLPGSSSLRTVVLNLLQIRKLPTLPNALRKLSLCCPKLEHISPLPSKIVVLSLQGCRSLTKLPTMQPLQNLLEMEILQCPKIKKIKGLRGLKALRILSISTCRVKSLQELDELTSLKKLTLQDCRLLRKLCVRSLQNLIELEILRCPEIEEIEGLEGLHNLRALNISSSGIRSLSGFDKLTSLRRLTVLNCGSLPDSLYSVNVEGAQC